MNPLLIASLVSALFAGAIGYGTASHFCTVKVTQMELEQANERIAIQRQSRATAERLTATVTAAQDEAQRRAVVLMRDADRSRVAADGLRDTSNAAVRASTDSCDACRAIAATYDQLFSESIGLLQEVAGAADKCISDNQTLTSGWPK